MSFAKAKLMLALKASSNGAVMHHRMVQIRVSFLVAIYSCNHGFVGKSGHAAGTAGAHVRYITRPSAEAHILAARMPASRNQARAWLQEQEHSSRKNERMIDKIMGALPRELSREQQNQLVRDYAERMTQGRAPWFAAIHRKGKDADNPHMHLVIRDRDPQTGKKVAQLSSKGSTHRVRLAWEQDVNEALKKAGLSERVDRRSLKAQGIDRTPTVHIGPKAKGMDKKGHQPKNPAPIDHEPVGTVQQKAAKCQRMRDYRETTRIAYNARLQAELSRKHVLEGQRLQQAQERLYGSQKSTYEQQQQALQQRLQAKGLKRFVRNVTGRTERDKQSLAQSRLELDALNKQQEAQKIALELRQKVERQKLENQRGAGATGWLEKQRDRAMQQANKKRDNKPLQIQSQFNHANTPAPPQEPMSETARREEFIHMRQQSQSRRSRGPSRSR